MLLPDLLDRVGAVTGEETGERRIGREPAEKIVGDGGERVVTAEALVEGRRPLCGRRHGEGKGNDGGGKGSPELHAYPPGWLWTNRPRYASGRSVDAAGWGIAPAMGGARPVTSQPSYLNDSWTRAR